ncbi:MAG: DNA modification methylase [Pirellulales bacterium]|nr:DNA modification methylase [Pirellulales bacterium]
MKLPVHRWFRFSAGFSAEWAETAIREYAGGIPNVLDPFAGSGTTLLAADQIGAAVYGIEAHPFLYRIARAKLFYRTDPEEYARQSMQILRKAERLEASDLKSYPDLIHKCYDVDALKKLDVLRKALVSMADSSPAAELCWLSLIGILRKTSCANTAQWQYILPRKTKKNPLDPFVAFRELSRQIAADMAFSQTGEPCKAKLFAGDARTCEGVPDDFAQLVLCSPPYPNNYDYADATRLEMSFMQEIRGWGDLQRTIREKLVRSCSQHVPEKAIDLEEILSRSEVEPISDELSEVCRELAEVRLTRGGKKTYHLMVACYFLDLAQVWNSLRRVCRSPSRVCFVIGDSAPYGVYVPVMKWLGELALAVGFKSFSFEQTRERNVKWKNRKHRVPLCEGRLWIEG